MVRDGYKFAAPPVALGILAIALGWYAAGVALVLLAALVVYFFRDPERVPPSDPAAVVSPADGRIMEVVDETFDGRAGRRISIFLAVWNVHVNRAPWPGASSAWSTARDASTSRRARGPRRKMSKTSCTSKPSAG